MAHQRVKEFQGIPCQVPSLLDWSCGSSLQAEDVASLLPDDLAVLVAALIGFTI